MAIREIRKEGDPILRKECKEVKENNDRLTELINDMFDTMYEAEGIGLAAPQVGSLRDLFVVDVSEVVKEEAKEKKKEPDEKALKPYVFINAKILETKGKVKASEGCLSVPGVTGVVERPQFVKVQALDRDFNEFTLETGGLLARCILHENDHTHGILYVDKVEGELTPND